MLCNTVCAACCADHWCVCVCDVLWSPVRVCTCGVHLFAFHVCAGRWEWVPHSVCGGLQGHAGLLLLQHYVLCLVVQHALGWVEQQGVGELLLQSAQL